VALGIGSHPEAAANRVAADSQGMGPLGPPPMGAGHLALSRHGVFLTQPGTAKRGKVGRYGEYKGGIHGDVDRLWTEPAGDNY